MSISSVLKDGALSPLGYNYPNRAKLRGYFEDLLEAYEGGTGACLFLPSYIELARKLDCSPLDLHCSFSELRKLGYDHFTLGIHSPITLWHPAHVNAQP